VIGKGWVAAGDLVVGDKVQALDGDTSTVTGFKFEKLDKPISVYNLEVEDFHSYFVEDLLVHNSYLNQLKTMGYTVPGDMVNSHGHHILPQVGNGDQQKMLVKVGQQILQSVGIDPINGPENLVIAANAKGLHTKENVLALLIDLWANRDRGYDAIVKVLEYHGQIAAGIR
jgi:hypothetical protein